MNTSIIFSDYRFEFNLAQSDFEFKIFSGINDWNTKVDFLYQPNQRHTMSNLELITHIMNLLQETQQENQVMLNLRQTKYTDSTQMKVQSIFLMILN